MSSLEFTKLHKLESNKDLAMSPDEQICYLVSKLKGVIKSNWQVIAPTPEKRIIYFELQSGGVKLEMVQGYMEYLRNLQLGEKKIGVTDGKSRRTRNKRA